MGQEVKTMISVPHSRFKEIFSRDSYEKVRIQLPPGDWCSEDRYNIIEISTGKVVGYFTDGSWDNSYKVIPELCSSEDIENYYKNKLLRVESELDRYKKYYNNLLAYNKLSWFGKLKYNYFKWLKSHKRKGLGLYEYLESGNTIPYKLHSNNLNTLIQNLEESWKK